MRREAACLAPDGRVVGRFEYGSRSTCRGRPLRSMLSSGFRANWKSDIAPFALREIFRILRPGGELVFAGAGEFGKF